MKFSERLSVALVAGQLATILIIIGMWIGGINAMEKQLLVWLDDAEKQRVLFIEVQREQQAQINDILKYLVERDPEYTPYVPKYIKFR